MGFFLDPMTIRNLFSQLALSGLLLLASCGNGGTQPVTDTAIPKDSLAGINEQIRRDPGNLDLYTKRARIHMFRKDYGSALADMERVIAIDSSKADYLIAAADINFFTGKVSRAKQLLERAVEVNPDNIECKLRLAQLHHYLTNYDAEIKLLDEVLKKDVHNAQAYFMKGMMFKELGDTTKAVSSMQTAVEQEPDHYNAYIQLGLLTAAKRDPIAETYYMNALKINPSSEEALYHLGMYYQAMENWNAAIETYTTLLKVNPKHFDAHFNLGMIHAVKLDVVDEGMKYFGLAVEDNPQEPRGYYGLGFCYEKKGDIANAEINYRKALAVDPDYSNAAQALERLGK